jgi:hypothetical protein
LPNKKIKASAAFDQNIAKFQKEVNGRLKKNLLGIKNSEIRLRIALEKHLSP